MVNEVIYLIIAGFMLVGAFFGALITFIVAVPGNLMGLKQRMSRGRKNLGWVGMVLPGKQLALKPVDYNLPLLKDTNQSADAPGNAYVKDPDATYRMRMGMFQFPITFFDQKSATPVALEKDVKELKNREWLDPAFVESGCDKDSDWQARKKQKRWEQRLNILTLILAVIAVLTLIGVYMQYNNGEAAAKFFNFAGPKLDFVANIANATGRAPGVTVVR